MKIYVHKNGLTLVGKAWEIKQKLKEYSLYYSTISEWIQNQSSNQR